MLTENQFKAGFIAAVDKATELGETDIREIQMSGDKVDIYGIENEENLISVELAFYNAAADQLLNENIAVYRSISSLRIVIVKSLLDFSKRFVKEFTDGNISRVYINEFGQIEALTLGNRILSYDKIL